jgi:hypothetical protein
VSAERHRQVSGFQDRAYEDYLGARVLLNAQQLPQGTALAATCLEKSLKAIVALRGNTCPGHLTERLLRSVKNFDPGLHRWIDLNFVEFLRRAYKLRYLNDLKPGFSIHISRRRTLAELDELYSRLAPLVRFEPRPDGKPHQLVYEYDREAKTSALWQNNFVLEGIEKKAFVEQIDDVYGMLFDERYGVLQVRYQTTGTKLEQDWLAPGLRHGTSKTGDPTASFPPHAFGPPGGVNPVPVATSQVDVTGNPRKRRLGSLPNRGPRPASPSPSGNAPVEHFRQDHRRHP